MSIQDAIAKASARPAGKRQFSITPDAERVLSVTMAIAAELAVTRQRLDTVERLLEQAGIVKQDQIETFVPTEEAHAERGLWNQEYVARILRIVQHEIEELDAIKSGERTCEELHDELETEKA